MTKPMETRTVMYAADGNETEDRSQAVRGEVLELDDGNVVGRTLGWRTDEKALTGDLGETATRPREDES